MFLLIVPSRWPYSPNVATYICHMSKSDIHHRYLQLYNLRRTILHKKKCSNFRDWLLFLVRKLQPVNILSQHSVVLTKLQEGTKNAESTGWKLLLKLSTIQFSTPTGPRGAPRVVRVAKLNPEQRAIGLHPLVAIRLAVVPPVFFQEAHWFSIMGYGFVLDFECMLDRFGWVCLGLWKDFAIAWNQKKEAGSFPKHHFQGQTRC